VWDWQGRPTASIFHDWLVLNRGHGLEGFLDMFVFAVELLLLTFVRNACHMLDSSEYQRDCLLTGASDPFGDLFPGYHCEWHFAEKRFEVEIEISLEVDLEVDLEVS
jgi:hypothetical protein